MYSKLNIPLGRIALAASFLLFLGCKDTDHSFDPKSSPEPDEPIVVQPPGESSLSFNQNPGDGIIAQWPTAANVDTYRVFQDIDGMSGFSEIYSGPEDSFKLNDPIWDITDARYIIETCNEGGCTTSEEFGIGDIDDSVAYVKSANPHDEQRFGTDIGLSGDGKTLVVGSSNDKTQAVGINGDLTNIAPSGTHGSATVYKKNDQGDWDIEAYIRPSVPTSNSKFGLAVDISHDGNTIVVGTSDGSADPQDPADTSAFFAGSAFVFNRDESGWSETAYLKAPFIDRWYYFGSSVGISGDGTRIIVGSEGEASNATGVNGDFMDTSLSSAGASYIYKLNEGSWDLEAYLKAPNTESFDGFGSHVDISTDGNRVAVSAEFEKSLVGGSTPDMNDNSGFAVGSVYTYTYSTESDTWSFEQYIKPAFPTEQSRFGGNLSLSGDGETLSISAVSDPSNATGINGDESNTEASDAGALYVFKLTDDGAGGKEWIQDAYIKKEPEASGIYFGMKSSLNHDGTVLAAGYMMESGNYRGVPDYMSDQTSESSGGVYLYKRDVNGWYFHRYLKAINADSQDNFGEDVSLSSDGKTMAISAKNEDGDATLVQRDLSNNNSLNAGAVYIY